MDVAAAGGLGDQVLLGPGFADLEQRRTAVEVEHVEPRLVTHPACVTAEDEPEPRRPRVAKLGHRPGGDAATTGQHDQPVAQALDQVELMAREQHPDPVAGVVAQQIDHRVDGQRVQPGERLVEDEGDRSRQHGRDDLDPLLVAQRELLQVVLGALSQSPRSSGM